MAGSGAKYKGNGTINGVGDYQFMLTATDGQLKGDGPDCFRMKIWQTDTNEIDGDPGRLGPGR